MLHTLIVAALVATPSPSPSPSPTPAYALHGAFSLYTERTSNSVAPVSQTDLSNALLTLSKTTGQLQGSVTVGAYAFPVVGQSIVATTQQGANTSLYGYVPAYDLAYVPNGNVTISAGQLATVIGQENGFTFQNFNIERGLVWAAEPAFSRGVRVAYANGKISGDLEYNDGYYSANAGRAVEGLAGWAPSATTDWLFAFIIPGANTPPNVTTTVANKREFDFMLTQQFGKLELEPYVLYIQSPASAALGYSNTESALGIVALANYAFNNVYSLGGRFESFANHSSAADASPNADLVGYGPGSSAASWTITPEYHPGPLFLRAEYSYVTFINQSRFLAELGVQF